MRSDNTAAAWLWVDVTTSWRARRGQMNGSLRVEQSYAKELNRLMAAQVRFCRYDRMRRCFRPLDAYPDLAAKPDRAHSTVQQPSALRAIGRQIERKIRIYRRDAYSSIVRRWNRGAMAEFAGDGAPQVLLMAGENWSHYDFDVIARLRSERGIAVAAVCQDMIPIACPQFSNDEEFVARFRAYADFLIRHVDLVIAISESTKSDTLKYARERGGMSGRIAVVQLGADLVSVAAARPPGELLALQPRRFVLSVSTIQPRKNFDLLYRLWRRLAEENVPDLPTLVIAGQRAYGGDDLLSRIAHDRLTADKIAVVHRVGDEELSWLYQNCLWTLYPSFYEGWGLPISESLAYGKYCLASNASSLPEAGAGLVKHLDPRDIGAWRDAVLALLTSPTQLAQLESAIRAAYRPMTWARSAENLMKELMKLRPAPSATAAEPS